MSNNNTYFVTGATGLVGSYICRQIRQEGAKVLALRRTSSKLPQNLDVEWVEGDLFDVLWLEKILQNVDFVVHAAGRVSFKTGQKDALMRDNVTATANLVNAALNSSIQKFCYISSIAVFNANDHNGIFSEKSTWDSEANHSDYALTKYLGEQEVWRGVREGLDAVIVNPSVVLGQGDWTKSSLQLISYIWSEPYFYPTGKVGLVDVRDVAEVVLKLLQSQVQAERFILNAYDLSFQDFFEKVAQNLHRKAPQKALREWIWKTWKNSAKFFRLLSDSPLWDSASIEAAINPYQYDNQKIRKALNFEFKNIEQTISWTCEAFKK